METTILFIPGAFDTNVRIRYPSGCSSCRLTMEQILTYNKTRVLQADPPRIVSADETIHHKACAKIPRVPHPQVIRIDYNPSLIHKHYPFQQLVTTTFFENFKSDKQVILCGEGLGELLVNRIKISPLRQFSNNVIYI